MSLKFPISILVDDVQVDGLVTVDDEHRFTIDITSPYTGLRSGVYRHSFQRWIKNSDFGDNDLTRDKASDILKSIYKSARIGLKNLELARQTFAALEMIEGFEAAPTNKPQLKRQFKEGLLSQCDYQQKLEVIKDAKASLKFLLYDFERQLVNNLFEYEHGCYPPTGWQDFVKARLAMSS